MLCCQINEELALKIPRRNTPSQIAFFFKNTNVLFHNTFGDVILFVRKLVFFKLIMILGVGELARCCLTISLAVLSQGTLHGA